MTRADKIIKRKERAAKRRANNRVRYTDWKVNKERFKTRRCDSCGGRESWCGCCQMWTMTCCIDYGTCMCS